jgi:hypothetical protein
MKILDAIFWLGLVALAFVIPCYCGKVEIAPNTSYDDKVIITEEVYPAGTVYDIMDIRTNIHTRIFSDGSGLSILSQEKIPRR